MYRFLFRTACAARCSSVNVYDSCTLPVTYGKAAAPIFRTANGVAVTPLSTSSVRVCEKKDIGIPSGEDDKTNNDKEAGSPTEKAKMAEEMEEAVVLKAEDGRTQQQRDVKAEQVAADPTQADPVKSGKESLLELLGAMKVEVTNKRKLRTSMVNKNNNSTTQYKTQPPMESTISMFQKATEEASSQSVSSETLDPELVSAASAAAATLPNSSQAVSELLRQLRQRKAMTEAQKKGDENNLEVIIADMKVGKYHLRKGSSDQIRFDDDGKGYTEEGGITAELDSVHRRRNLFHGKRLNIFSRATDQDVVESTVAQPTLWDVEFANELSQVTNQMPPNVFEEMIQWTKEGKLWQYPINNEIGLEEEASVPFHEHVLLEKHLEDGFPRKGPVRHFMELVVAGLSRNPYLTVEQKKEHIFWFKDYFHEKEEVLKEADG
ncbi:small ribosomal subunit protein mS31 [Parambassis ranga]|uniref:Small ribosomal subunit protein mS31 n=1 Tax=Parambassis ranga TaxID=210632 RepID=A0A6P7JPI3_9TELE|nr:28S ribosomal protein S31, mitochondrial [Parambassis ranga]